MNREQRRRASARDSRHDRRQQRAPATMRLDDPRRVLLEEATDSLRARVLATGRPVDELLGVVAHRDDPQAESARVISGASTVFDWLPSGAVVVVEAVGRVASECIRGDGFDAVVNLAIVHRVPGALMVFVLTPTHRPLIAHLMWCDHDPADVEMFFAPGGAA